VISPSDVDALAKCARSKRAEGRVRLAPTRDLNTSIVPVDDVGRRCAVRPT
jgi:hypothetical protein